MNLKSVERAWKTIFFRGATLALGGSGRRAEIPTAGLRILVLRQDRIGDAVVTTGVLRVLKNSHPGNVVDVIASPANAPILRRDPNVGAVHIYDKRKRSTFPSLYAALRKSRYDVVIDCMITAPSMTGLLLMLASGAKHRVGIAGRGVDAALTAPVPLPPGKTHIIDLMASLASPISGDGKGVDFSPYLTIQHHERENADNAWQKIADPSSTRLLVNVSAGKAEREWPRERYVAVIEGILGRFPSLAVGLVGSPNDRARTAEIANASGAMVLDTPQLVDLVALVATADCVLTPDTSVTHIASALKVPAVVLFQHAAIADQWGLYRSPGKNIVGGVDSLIDLPVASVLPEVAAMVAERVGEMEARIASRPPLR